MKRMIGLLAFWASLVFIPDSVFCQATPDKMAFEVASVKAATWSPAGARERSGGVGGGCPTSSKMDQGRVDVQCATISTLIGYAFRISADRITGPNWMVSAGAPRFDIAAKIPQGASKYQVPEMFQALLAERFRLVFHRGNAEHAAYSLVVAKRGPKLTEVAPQNNPKRSSVAEGPDTSAGTEGFLGAVQTRTIPNTEGHGSTTSFSNPSMGTVRQTGDPWIPHWEAHSISAAGLADLLDTVAPWSTPVVDMTGLKGRFQMVLDVDLRGVRPGMVSVDGNSTEMEEAVLKGLNDGLQKLGLKLERRKAMVEVLVVDHVEKTPTEN